MLAVLENNPLIPVVTFQSMDEVDTLVQNLLEKKIRCIEITLRTPVAFEAMEYIKKNYAEKIAVGAGTVVSTEQIDRLVTIGVDFMVSPGLCLELADAFEFSNIPFIPGVATPSDIISGMQRGWHVFKFFPANLFGGIPALKTYGQVFSSVRFCPTGGITEATCTDYLALPNVVSVGGSWMVYR